MDSTPRIDDQLKTIKGFDNGRPRKKVTILGAGIAGLAAGYELTRLGHSVQIFEGSNRIGGRIWTHRFDDGTYGELGAMRIPLNHDYTRYYVAQLGLKLRKFVTAHENLECFYDIRNIVTRMRDGQTCLYPLFALSPEQQADRVPPDMFGRTLRDVIDGLTVEERTSLLSPTVTSERVRELDRISLGEFLRIRAGNGAKELIGSSTALDSFFDRALTMFLRDALEQEGAGFHEIQGGMELLPQELGKTLRANIQLNTEVTGIHMKTDGKIEIDLVRHGRERHHETCDIVLCTLPFSILRTIDISPPFSHDKMYAIRNLSYSSSTKVLLHCRQRFWETTYGIYGGASQTDQLIRATYYPSDNVRVVQAPRPSYIFSSLYSGYTKGEFGAEFQNVSEGPGVLLGSYTWGQDARRLGAMAPEQRAHTAIRLIARFHPEMEKEGMVDGHASMFWDSYEWSLGSFSFLQPGEHSTIFEFAIQPEDNVHFAGEHCSLQQAWIQGALVSALRAVKEIVSR